MLLVVQRRYNEAEEVMNRILPGMSDPSPARGRLAWIHRCNGSNEQAIEEMAAAVSAAPWYLWGWKVLMQWLIEDQKWDMARRLLSPAPPEVSSDSGFRKQRLLVLENAGLVTAELDTEWNSLLRDLPERVSLHLARYDSSERIDELAKRRWCWLPFVPLTRTAPTSWHGLWRCWPTKTTKTRR
jgi:hypothetical protein